MTGDKPEPGDLSWSVIEPHWQALCTELSRISDYPDSFDERFAPFPRHVVLLYAVNLCDTEVRNGGFMQYFYSSSGALASEAIAGFRALGLVRHAQVIERAAEFFGDAVPRGLDERRRRLQELESTHRFDDLNREIACFSGPTDAYLDLIGPDSIELLAAADAYAQQHQAP